jgi:hypothetical protein
MEEHNQEVRFCVRIGDLDLNRHVNHVVYIQWALESVPREVLAKCRPVDIEVAYRGEAKKGEIVLARTQALDGENRFLHQLVRESDGKELTRLRTELRPPAHAPTLPLAFTDLWSPSCTTNTDGQTTTRHRRKQRWTMTRIKSMRWYWPFCT